MLTFKGNFMKRNILLSVATAFTLLFSTNFAIVSADATTVKVSTVKIQNDTEHYFTSNGIEVVLKKIKTNDVIGLKLFIKGGSRNINEKNAGIEPLLLNLMLQGSKEFPKDKMNMELAKIGAQIENESFFDYSAFSLKSLNKYFDKAFNIFQSLINQPLLEQSEVDLEKSKTLAEIKHNIDDPDEYIWSIVNKTFSAGHPYFNNFQGELNTIPNITRQDLVNYLKTNLTGSKLLLVIAGNYKDGIKKDIEKYFGKIPKGNNKNTPISSLKVNKSTLTVVDRDIPTAYVAARFTAPNIKNKDYPATYLGLRILSEKFHETIRTKHGLSYAVSAGSSLREANSGYLYVTTVKPKESVQLMYQEIDNLKKNLIDKKYLNGVRNLYYTEYFMKIEPNLSLANTLGVNQLQSGDYNNSYKLIEKFRKVTPEEIRDAMKKYIKNIHFGIIYKKDLIDSKAFTKM